MTFAQSSPLPNELWIRILENLNVDEDLPTLWMSCRYVSTAFKEATESIFREKHLPKTRFYFYLGEYWDDGSTSEEDGIHHLAAGFEFSALSEDRVTATFTVDDDELSEDLQPRTRKRLREYLGNIDIEVPQHTVQIRRDVNDGPIPGISMDYEKLELSCNWRELFSAFYSEEYLYHNLTAKQLKLQEPFLADLKAKVDRGEMNPMEAMTKALTAFEDDSKTCRKLARRARLRWQFKEHDGTEWDFERDGNPIGERNRLAELQKIRHFASMEDFSDEGSVEDDDEEDEEDEDEEDEWEDSDSDEDSN